MIKAMFLAGCGGFVGTCARFLVNRICTAIWTSPWPLATMIVNLLGCFLIGLFFGLIERSQLLSPAFNVLLITGFCGGFTTFSALANELWTMSSKGLWLTSLLYLVATVVGGVALVWLGRTLSK